MFFFQIIKLFLEHIYVRKVFLYKLNFFYYLYTKTLLRLGGTRKAHGLSISVQENRRSTDNLFFTTFVLPI